MPLWFNYRNSISLLIKSGCVPMLKYFSITLVDYVHFFNGNLFQYLGEALHIKTNERFVLTRNAKKELVAVPKNQFEKYAIKDRSVLDGKQKEMLEFTYSQDVTQIDGQSYYTIGYGTHSNTHEKLTFYLSPSQKVFVN